jgi:uridine kinase
LVAVDGLDGGGKTAFAESLATAYTDLGRAAHVVHMDDFLNPRSVRYRMGRTSPEGFFRDTCDRAAFTTRVLDPLKPCAPSRPSSQTLKRNSTTSPSDIT